MPPQRWQERPLAFLFFLLLIYFYMAAAAELAAAGHTALLQHCFMIYFPAPRFS